jgi:plastocyanin
MHFSKAIILAAASTASAATIQVEVGKAGLTFSPNDITAAVGDSVEFTFFPKVSLPFPPISHSSY